MEQIKTKGTYEILKVQRSGINNYGVSNYTVVLKSIDLELYLIVRTKSNSSINFRITSDTGKKINAVIRITNYLPILENYEII